MKRKAKKSNLLPDFLQKQKKSLVRKYRKAILFNEKEISAINLYCDKYNVKNQSAFFRDVIISHILEQLDDNYPKLF